MASTSRSIRVRFDGTVAPLVKAAASAKKALAGVSKFGLGVGKGLAGLAAGGAAVQTLVGLAAAASQLAPAALLLPGALLAGAAAMAAFKLATAGFTDAISAADPAAFAEATKNMAPAAVAAAQAVRDAKPAFTDLKKEVQGRFFAGFADDVRSLSATYIPVLKTGLGDVAGEMNLMGRAATQALLKPSAVNDVNEVLRGTTGMLRNARTAVGDLVSGFLGLGGVGATYLPRLGTAISDVSARFKTWVDQGVESGRINELIDGAIAGFKDLAAIAGNLGSIVGSIFSGLSAGSGQSFLTSIRETTDALAVFFASAAAQGPLQALGETMRVAGSAVRDILLAALRALGPIIEAVAPFVQQLATSLGTALVGALNVLGPPIAQLLAALGGALAPLLPILAQAFVGLATALAPVFTALAPVATMLGQVLAPIFVQLQPLIQQIATALGTFLVTAIQAIAPLLPPIITAFADVVAAVLPLLPPILQLATTLLPVLADIFATFVVPAIQLAAAIIVNVLVPAIAALIQDVQNVVNFFAGAWGTAKDIVAGAVEGIRGILNWFGELPGRFRGWIGGARDAISNGFNSAVQYVAGIPGRVMGALGNLGGLLSGAGRSLVDGFLSGIRGAWDRVTGFVRSGVQAVRNLFPFSPAKEGPFSGRGYTSYSGAALTGDFADSIRKGLPEVRAAAAAVMNAGQAAMTGTSPAAAIGRWSGELAAAGTSGGPDELAAALADVLAQHPPLTQVTVLIDGQEFRGIVRTELATDRRTTRARVGAGAGRGI